MSVNQYGLRHAKYQKEAHDKRGLGSVVKLGGLVLGPLLLAVTLLIPMPLEWPQHCLLGIILMTVVYWIAQPIPIPVTSILSLTLAVVLDVAPATTVFGAFSSPVLFLLIGGFLMTLAIVKYGLGKRIALAVLCVPGVGGSTKNIVIAFGVLSALLSGVIDNGAVASMLVPIAIGIVHALAEEIRQAANLPAHAPTRFATALMLITAYGATVGALLTPFGDASNMVGRQFIQDEFDQYISIGSWMALSVPIVLVLFALLATVVLYVNSPELSRLTQARKHFVQQRRQLGPMSRGEINTAMVFGLAVFLWMLPAIASLIAGRSSEIHLFLTERMPPSVVAVLAASCLFILPVGGAEGATLRWRDVRKMDWGPILLVGSALALGSLINETGLAQTIGYSLAEKISGIGQLGISFFASATAILFSEISNNLVSITVLVPSIVPLAQAGGGDPFLVALIATFSAIYGFMLPISTSANAIVYGSGQVPVWKMIKTGFIVDLSGIVIIVLGITFMLSVTSLFPH